MRKFEINGVKIVIEDDGKCHMDMEACGFTTDEEYQNKARKILKYMVDEGLVSDANKVS